MEVLGLVRYACQLARWHYLLVNIDMPCRSRALMTIFAPSLLCSSDPREGVREGDGRIVRWQLVVAVE